MLIDILSIFPAMFSSALNESMIKIAQEKDAVGFNYWNLRDFTTNKHRKVDAPPFGGGPGMVMMAEPFFRAVEHVKSQPGRENSRLIMFSPAGLTLNQTLVHELSLEPGLILMCGHYEGVDERVSIGLEPLEISIGDYVLSSGEIPAMVLIDAVVRLLPGVLGCAESLSEESFASGILEYPQYTRPRVFRGMRVPEILLNGNHRQIKKWRAEKALERTRQRRRDLLQRCSISKEEIHERKN